jgi:O-antigen/teichoic acid export membrane protein
MKSIRFSHFVKSNLFTDSLLNILASLILTIATQIIAYPYLAGRFSLEEYGLILTIMGVINTIGVSFGNSLNNCRLLVQSDYDQAKLQGDFNIIFLVITILVGVFIVPLLIKILNISLFEAITYMLVTNMVAFRSYYSVSFRIIIDYKRTLILHFWGLIGFLIGIFVASITNIWILIFVSGEVFMCGYLLFKSHIIRDKYIITVLIQRTISKYYFILGAAILANVMLYLDRFLIFPLLGAGLVSTYAVASFLGKTAGIIMNPISGVLLTYYAKESNISIKAFYGRVLIFLVGSIMIYLGILLIGANVTHILYPDIVEEALPYFKIANLAAIVLIFGNTVQPLLLRYCHSRWQLITQLMYLLVYLSLSYYGMVIFGLIGFCYAILISNTFRAMLMITVVVISLEKNSKGLNTALKKN